VFGVGQWPRDKGLTESDRWLYSERVGYRVRGPEKEEELKMTKFGLIAATAAALALAACGGSTKTVTLTSSAPSGTPSSSGTAVPSSVIACFKQARARIRGPNPAGRGSAIYVKTRDGGSLGYVKAPNAAVAIHVSQVFAGSGNKIKPIKGQTTAFGFSKGTVTSADSALLSKCAK
jgi:hypothetical protein